MNNSFNRKNRKDLFFVRSFEEEYSPEGRIYKIFEGFPERDELLHTCGEILEKETADEICRLLNENAKEKGHGFIFGYADDD